MDKAINSKFQLVRKINSQNWEFIGAPLDKKDLDLLIDVEFSVNLVETEKSYDGVHRSFIGLIQGPNNKAQSIEVSWFEIAPKESQT